jgi:hypothetical protein
MEPKANSIGMILDENAARDAIHVAIAPVIAAHDIEPGTHVGVCDCMASPVHLPKIGILDPYIGRTIKAGERVWLLLQPGTVNKLRHTWEHQSLPGPERAPKVLTKEDKYKIVQEYLEENNLQTLDAEIDTECAGCW